MACQTVWYSSGMQGAPSLSGQVGAGIALLSACLVNGLTSVTLTSLTVSSSVATATISGGHAFLQWSVVEIAGASPSGLNGRKRVLSVTGTTFTFDATGISNQTATGTITAKVPAAGLTLPYTGTNIAAYRNDSVSGTGSYLRVDDTDAQSIRVVGYQAMTDANTGTDPFPTAAQISGGGYFRKSSAASSATRNWVLVADSKFFYLVVDTDNAGTYKAYCFGDFVTFASGSAPWDCMISCGSSATGTPYLGYTDGSTANQKNYIPRIFAGTGTAVLASKGGVRSYSALTTADAYPHPSAGGILGYDFSPVYEGASSANMRGKMPGYIGYLNNCNSALTWNTPHLLDGFAEYILPIKTGDSSAPVFGVSLGDWR